MNLNRDDRATHHTRPAPVVSPRFALEVSTLLVIQNPPKAIGHAWWNVGNAFKRAVLCHCIQNIFPRCGPQCLLIGVLHSGNGTVLIAEVAGDVSGIIGALVVITAADGIETVNNVSALEVLLPEMMSTVCRFGVFAQDVKGPVGVVPGIAFLQGT
jgi:hypothetical protein